MHPASETRGRTRCPATFDVLVKRALLNVFGPVCTYRGIPIEEKHASVDHAIPTAVLKGDRARCAEVVAKFGFQPGPGDPLKDFRNLVLTDVQYNREKWDHVDGEWEEVIRKGLRVAGENARAVEEEFLYLKLQDQVELSWAKLPEAARSRANAARLHDQLTNVAGQGRSEERCRNNLLTVRRPLVTLSAHLPAVERPEGTACITLTPLRVRGCAITFGHDEIVGTLLPGFGSELSHDRRRFVAYVPREGGDVTVQLGNNRISLTPAEAGEPCDAVDRLAVHYLGAMRGLESRVFESLRFPRARGGVVLGTATLDTWEAVLRHASDHSGSRVDAAGMSFQVEGTHAVAVACAMPNDPGHALRARIVALPAWERFAWRSGLRMRVCWDAEPLPQAGERGVRESHYRTGVRWSAGRTDAWLRQTLLPALLPPRRRGWFGRDGHAPVVVFDPAVRRRSASQVAEGDEFTTRESAAATLGEIQRFFSTYDWRSVSAAAQRGLYTFLLWSLEHSGPGEGPARYVHLTLPIPHRPGATSERICGAIDRLRHGGRVPANIVDYALRCALELVDKAEWQVPPFELLDAAEEHLRALCEEYRAMEYLEGLASDAAPD